MRKDKKYSLATSDLMSPGYIFIFMVTERKVEAVEQPRKAEFVCRTSNEGYGTADATRISLPNAEQPTHATVVGCSLLSFNSYCFSLNGSRACRAARHRRPNDPQKQFVRTSDRWKDIFCCRRQRRSRRRHPYSPADPEPSEHPKN